MERFFTVQGPFSLKIYFLNNNWDQSTDKKWHLRILMWCIHPWPNFNACLTKPPFKLGHVWIIIFHGYQYMPECQLIIVSKRVPADASARLRKYNFQRIGHVVGPGGHHWDYAADALRWVRYFGVNWMSVPCGVPAQTKSIQLYSPKTHFPKRIGTGWSPYNTVDIIQNKIQQTTPHSSLVRTISFVSLKYNLCSAFVISVLCALSSYARLCHKGTRLYHNDRTLLMH